MRTPRTLLVAALLGLFLFPSTPARAGWGPDGSTIKATTSSIPKISAAGDGGQGTIVVWQEESTPGTGVLRALHVLSTGDPDPAWAPDGALLCGALAARPSLGVVSDGQGGAYVWWKESSTIFLTHVAANGTVAAGWPARGRVLGSTIPLNALPSAIEDGAHGVYVAWTTYMPLSTDYVLLDAVHLGPANTGAGGWTNGVRELAGGDPVSTQDLWPQLALAPDGGLFVAWAKWSDDPSTVNSAFLLRRVTSAGLNASGWPSEGLELATFHGEWLGYPQYSGNNPAAGLVGLSPDGRGGVFVMLGEPTGPPEFFNQGGPLETRLFRLQGDGQSAADWPTGGTLVSNAPYEYFDGGPEAGYRVLPDGLDGVQVGVPGYGEYGSSYSFSVLQADGNGKPSSSVGGALPGYDMIPNARGGVFLADFNGSGPYGPYQPWAYLRVTQSLPGANWSDFFEIHFDIVVQWYGDIALAPAGDAGAVFFWSQVRDRTGLFARRFNSAGEVTGVPPGAPSPPAVLALSRLRFVAGSGVMARVALPDDRGARLDLFDVSGRRVASSRLEGLGAGSRDVAVPESSRLASGLYFARLAAAGETRAGRVMVAR